MASRPEFSRRGTAIGINVLNELALDLRSSWHHGADELWAQLDPDLWALTRNPWAMLQSTPPARRRAVLARPGNRELIARLRERRRRLLTSAAWFQRTHERSPLTQVAYFSMEFALSEGLPIYSGGLGNVAGDQLKAASDLGVPVIGVGLLYQQGYFRQVIAADGSQEALYPYNDPHDPANPPAARGITTELYGGGAELRLRQELLLGIGGWRLLRALRLEPKVCHLNEGHAAFAVLERARCFMEDTQQPFDAALAATRAGNMFTTHTPVAAGFDRVAPAVMEPYPHPYAEEGFHIAWPGRSHRAKR